MANSIWTREETIIAFNVYCKIPFNKSSKSHPLVVKYAKIIGRTPDALNMKIGNIGRLDPSLREKGITGLGHGAKMEEIVWDEFCGNPEKLAYESECLISKYSKCPIEKTSMIDLDNLPEGKERETVIKQRINQSFFRSTVLSSYNFKCCISGVCVPELLEACHIVDWSLDKTNRLNPTNGLCLNPFFHKSYDKNLVSITPDYSIVVSERLLCETINDDFKLYLQKLNGKSICKPDKFNPDKKLLDIHYQMFKKQ